MFCCLFTATVAGLMPMGNVGKEGGRQYRDIKNIGVQEAKDR